MRRQHFITFLGGAAAVYRRDLVIAPAAQQRLPRLYRTWFVARGGLISYGSDLADLSGARQDTSIASSRARSQPICRSGADQIRYGDQSDDRQRAALSRRTCSSPPTS